MVCSMCQSKKSFHQAWIITAFSRAENLIGNAGIMTKIIGREIKDAIQRVTQPSEILLFLICFWEKYFAMADGEEYIIGWSKPSWLFWSQQSHIDLHYLMVSARKFVIIKNTTKVQVCHWRRAGGDDRKESSFLLKQKDDSNGKLSCTSLPSGYDATTLGGTAVWATILKNSWEAKKQECLAAGSIKQEGM